MLELFGEQQQQYAPLVVPDPWIRQSSAARALIFYYHRISEETCDPCMLNVSPDNFARQVEVFTRELNCITLADLTQALAQNTLRQRTAVITLDDGYADALHRAWPILERFSAPATIFVTTRNSEALSTEFWWDHLEQIILTPGQLPERLSLLINGHEKTWQLEARQPFSLEQQERYSGWNIHMAAPTERHALFQDLHRLLASLTEEERLPLLDELDDWAGRQSVCRETRRTLSLAEMKQLAQCDNIELGAHTMTHPVLAQLDDEQQLKEIAGSKNILEQVTQRRVQSFAYPYGRRGDFTDSSVEIVRDAGYTSACCTVADVAWAGSDRYRLPRIPMPNCNAELLSGWLKLWF